LEIEIKEMEKMMYGMVEKKTELDELFCEEYRRKIDIGNAMEEARNKITELREVKSKTTEEHAYKSKSFSKPAQSYSELKETGGGNTRERFTVLPFKPHSLHHNNKKMVGISVASQVMNKTLSKLSLHKRGEESSVYDLTQVI
jgi:hypothetical protein